MNVSVFFSSKRIFKTAACVVFISLLGCSCSQARSYHNQQPVVSEPDPIAEHSIHINDTVLILSGDYANYEGVVTDIDPQSHPVMPVQVNVGNDSSPIYVWESYSNLKHVNFTFHN